jgi:mannose-1-phosphate guanylyltransferase
MKAMILAAGLGTRLRPLTDDRPKALVKIAGRTLLEITLHRLRDFGIREVIVNVHHFGDMVVDYLKTNDNFGMRIEVSREEALLDTGGGLKKAAWFLQEESSGVGEPFLLHNVDVLSTIDLQRMLQSHRETKALATLAVQHRETSRYLLFDAQNQLCGRRSGRDQPPETIRSLPLPPPQVQALAFSGIHVISPRLLSLMTEPGVFSIIDTYLRLAGHRDGHQEGHEQKIVAFRADDYYWRDLGKPENIAQAERDVEQRRIPL